MNSLTRKVSIAAAILATAGVFGANAADNTPAPATEQVSASAPIRTAHAEFPQLEYFESQEQLMSAPSYTPSEHPDAKPAPHSAHLPPSVWSDPLNTASLGN